MKTNTKVPKTPFFAAFSVGAVLFSAHAGGGFATGNQANTYYVGLGWTGIISAIAAMLLDPYHAGGHDHVQLPWPDELQAAF